MLDRSQNVHRESTVAPARRQWLVGTVAGLVAGIVMSMLMMAYMAIRGNSVWTMPNLISVLWLGEVAAGDEFTTATLVGLITHLITSALMGVIAIPFIANLPPTRTVLVAFAYAVASYPVAFSAVISWANPLMMERTRMIPMTIGHALFGVVLAVVWLALLREKAGGNSGAS